jgi:hypothetical protein
MDKKLKAYDKDNNEIHEGDLIKDFRGVYWLFTNATRVNDEAHDGKVCVKHSVTLESREFYAGVFDLTVK